MELNLPNDPEREFVVSIDTAHVRASPAEAGRNFERHCQSKFYTACSRTRAGWSSTVFARELPPRSAEFNAENRLYSFALMVWTSPARHLAQ